MKTEKLDQKEVVPWKNAIYYPGCQLLTMKGGKTRPKKVFVRWKHPNFEYSTAAVQPVIHLIGEYDINKFYREDPRMEHIELRVG